MTLQADLIAKREELAAKRAALAAKFTEVDGISDETKKHEAASGIKAMNLELAALVDEIAPLQELVEAQKANSEAIKAMRGTGRQIQPENESDEDEPDEDAFSAKSIHELTTKALKANGIKSFKGFRGDLGAIAGKTLLTSSAATPLEERLPQIYPSAQESRTTADLMLQGTTGAQIVSYYVETTFTNAAVETDEGALKGESTLAFTLREDRVRKIATWIPVTDEMLDDIPGFESYLTARMGFMVKQREERQLLQGDGAGLNIQGILNRPGIQIISGLGISTIDSILYGITLVQANAFAEPTAMVVHPLDWFDIRSSKATGTGEYLLGPAYQGPDVRPWGLEVRVTSQEPQNTALIGAFTPHAQIYRRSPITLAISTENEDYFTKNKVAVRAEERLALAVYRPAAFVAVQSIVQGS